ncbi:MAG: dihydroorotase [bacterium]|nr:dihydroorotase [bacterium]
MGKRPIFLTNGRIIDPASGLDTVGNLLIEDGKITALGDDVRQPKKTETLDCTGNWIIPGIVDIHVHLSEPKRYDRETVKSFTEAAISGGVTTAVIRPSDDLLIDDITVVEFISSRNRKVGKVNILPAAAMTRAMMGEKLTDFGDLKAGGAVAVGDDGRSVMSSAVMRRALEYARDLDLPAFTFPQDKDLAAGGYMNEGATSSLFGLKGIPYSAEEVMVTRDIILARMTGAHVHISPITTAGSVELAKRAKDDGINITCDTAPQYFILDETSAEGYDTNAKVLPPLRRERDLAALREGLFDGTIDAIASGHEPLSIVDKDTPFAAAEFGISGVELQLPLVLTHLYSDEADNAPEIVKLLTSGPASIVDLETGKLNVGATADVTVVDTERRGKITRNSIVSRGKNTPFLNTELTGFPKHTINRGTLVYKVG